MATILSVQSHVAYGHVGNAAATFPLQRLGHEVWPVHTVQFSNHTGYPDWKGQVFDPAHVADILVGLDHRGALGRCDAVLSGYLGAAALGQAVLACVARVRASRPSMLYCCDPVMGDDGPGLYVPPAIVALFREQACRAADILTPNRFELEMLTDLPPLADLPAIRAAASGLLAAPGEPGPRMVLVTSLPTAAGRIGMMLVQAQGAWMVDTPLLPLPPRLSGAGDTAAALFLGALLAGRTAPEAMAHAAGALFEVLRATSALGRDELALIPAQDALATPPWLPPIVAL
jgi:pyridoxine kinase